MSRTTWTGSATPGATASDEQQIDAADLSTLDALEPPPDDGETAFLDGPAQIDYPRPTEYPFRRLTELEGGLAELREAVARIEGRLAGSAANVVLPGHYALPTLPVKAPPPIAKPPTTTPHQWSVYEWARASFAAGKTAGRWSEARPVAKLVAELVVEPLVEFHSNTEGDEGADSLALAMIGLLEIAAAFGVDLPKAMASVLGK